MTLLSLFASTFFVVFALGIQQLNVQNNHRLAAIFTLAPSANWAEICAYIAGGPAGIYAAMVAHPWLVRVIRRKK